MADLSEFVRILGCPVTLLSYHPVTYLFIQGGKEWDRELVLQTFYPLNAIHILNTPVSQAGLQDKFIWRETKDGKCTVQSVGQQSFAISVWLSSNGKLGMGCRSWQEGGIFQYWTDAFMFSGDLSTATLWTIRWGLLKILSLGWPHVHCMVPDEALVSLLTVYSGEKLSGSIVLEDIQHLMSNFDSNSFSYEKQKVDEVCILAKKALLEL
ncbi:peptidase T [Striga asiatica]|uniref:Peptidase T n=1 Tax=Striga asiatica TaxID=4170 RepID=A0A5A7PFH1_STRAF|nr:peptidase T [Striga asiatica]